jgi:Fic family protein
MGRLRAATIVLAALAACLLLAACGSSGNGELLPGTTADQINSNLDLVRESNAEGNCEEAEEAVAQVSEEIDALQGVDAEAEEQKEAEEAQAEEEAEREELEEAQAEEEEKSAEQEQKREEREEKAQEQERAEEEAEQPGPDEGEESGPKGKAKGQEKQEEVETPTEEEVIPPVEGGGPAGGIGPGAEAGGP